MFISNRHKIFSNCLILIYIFVCFIFCYWVKQYCFHLPYFLCTKKKAWERQGMFVYTTQRFLDLFFGCIALLLTSLSLVCVYCILSIFILDCQHSAENNQILDNVKPLENKCKAAIFDA